MKYYYKDNSDMSNTRAAKEIIDDIFPDGI